MLLDQIALLQTLVQLVTKSYKDKKLLEELQKQKKKTNIEHVFTKAVEAELQSLDNVQGLGLENQRMSKASSRKTTPSVGSCFFSHSTKAVLELESKIALKDAFALGTQNQNTKAQI
jgi:hypothetical protein